MLLARRSATTIRLRRLIISSKKKLVPHFLHLPYNWKIATKPNVGLLCGRRVEPPLSLIGNKFRPPGRVAVFIACLVALLVLALEVEHIHRKGTAIEVGSVLLHWLIPEHRLDLAVVVMEDNLGKGALCWE